MEDAVKEGKEILGKLEEEVEEIKEGVEEELEERKKKVFSYLKKDKNFLIWGIFIIIAWFGYYIRTRNLPLLKDVTTGKYIPLALDPHVFLRYVRYILEHGELMSVDYMRYYPWGYGGSFGGDLVEFKLLSYFIVYLYKFLHFFNSTITIEKVHVLYPPITFAVGLIFFFLLIRKLFDYRIALLSSLLLAIIPSYLYRTMAGFSDKEALGMVFFFAALYFFVCGWQSKKIKKSIIFGSLAGLSNGLMGLVWGGFAFLVSIIGLFGFISFVFLKFRGKNYISYVSWYVLFYLIMIIFRDYNLHTIIGSYFGAVATLALFVGLGDYLILRYNLKQKLEKKFKLPSFFIVFIAILILGIIFSFIVMGPGLIFNQIDQIYNTLTSPFGTDRWQLTVAEAHQPHLEDVIDQVGWKFFWVYIAGSMILVYNLLKNFDKKIRNVGFCVYALFILGFSFSRYSENSDILNGVNFFSQKIIYFGGILLLILVYFGYWLYTCYKDSDSFKKIQSLNKNYLLVLIWFFILLVASRSAIRLLFIFSTTISILVAYISVTLFDRSFKIKKDHYKIGVWILLFLILINPFSISSSFAYGLFDKGILIKYSQRSLSQSRYTSPSYNQQWQIAGEWVRENIPEDAVFAHWWDYGYWVQTGFQRATITDGGNVYGSLNHLVGRHVLTGQSEIEALEFLKAHNATNLLIISDEIGKYPAFSSIGGDENWDRYSWMPPFVLDPGRTQETREKIIYIYVGVSPIDWDFTYKGEFFPKGKSAIIGFFVPTKNVNETVLIENPYAIVVNDGQQKQIPVECVFFNGRELNFEQGGLKGCLQILPKIEDDRVNPIGVGIYVSEKVRRTLFAQLYLFGKAGDYFRLIYSDEANMPLSLFKGRIVGPLKIWEVNYPNNLQIPEYYYKDELPNPNVKSIKGRY